MLWINQGIFFRSKLKNVKCVYKKGQVLYMKDKIRKKDEFVIINKFKENSSVDVKKSIERVFKVFYNLQIKKI